MTQPLNRMLQNEKNRHKNRPCKRALTFRALALRQRKTWKLFLSDEGPTLETLDFTIRTYYLQYTNLFIFRFVSQLCLRSTLRIFKCDRMDDWTETQRKVPTEFQL